jgi:hypothetical protein
LRPKSISYIEVERNLLKIRDDPQDPERIALGRAVATPAFAEEVTIGRLATLIAMWRFAAV